MTGESNSRDEKIGYSVLYGMLLAVVAAFAAYWLLVARISGSPERGQFGDMFGGFNALFTAFAFAGLIFTAYLQRHELKLQRDELKETRDELKGQKEQLAAQRVVASQQLFESTFFQLLSLHHQIVDNLRFGVVANGPTGRKAMEAFAESIVNHVNSAPANPPGALARIRAGYSSAYHRNRTEFGHYFRNLYHIARFIDRADIADKSFYIGVLRAQLSAGEQFCLFYNCLSDLGREKFKPLLEKYALLHNLDLSLLIQPDHKSLYEDAAFGDV